MPEFPISRISRIKPCKCWQSEFLFGFRIRQKSHDVQRCLLRSKFLLQDVEHKLVISQVVLRFCIACSSSSSREVRQDCKTLELHLGSEGGCRQKDGRRTICVECWSRT